MSFEYKLDGMNWGVSKGYHCREKAQRLGGYQQWVTGVMTIAVRSGRWRGEGYSQRRSKSGWEQAKSSARGNSRDWQRLVYQSTMERTLMQSLPHRSFSNCWSKPAPLVWMVAEAVALAPEQGPLATKESPRRAVCQGLLIWARWVRTC